jgi:hypothetical protein
MVMPWSTIAQGAAKTISGWAKTKAKKKQNDESRRALIAQLTTGQKQREDSRLAHLNIGSSILGRVPTTTAGGGVNTGVALDPELVKQLGVERTYDFASTVPKDTTGASAYLGALMGEVGNTLDYYQPGNGSSPTSSSMLYDRGQGQQLPGGGPQTAPLYGVDGDGNVDRGAQPGVGSNISWEELFKQSGYGSGGPD